ncbi:MAG: glycosyltransferase [Synergistaceae bacterium]|nr:glycosyltransferase [Synergistaceae bacterium]
MTKNIFLCFTCGCYGVNDNNDNIDNNDNEDNNDNKDNQESNSNKDKKDRNNVSKIKSYIEALDQMGYDVCLFDLTGEIPFRPQTIMDMIEGYFGGNLTDNKYYFITDASKLLKLVYRVFHGIFSGFIYLSNFSNINNNSDITSNISIDNNSNDSNISNISNTSNDVTSNDVTNNSNSGSEYTLSDRLSVKLLCGKYSHEENLYKPIYCDSEVDVLFSDIPFIGKYKPVVSFIKSIADSYTGKWGVQFTSGRAGADHEQLTKGHHGATHHGGEHHVDEQLTEGHPSVAHTSGEQTGTEQLTTEQTGATQLATHPGGEKTSGKQLATEQLAAGQPSATQLAAHPGGEQRNGKQLATEQFDTEQPGAGAGADTDTDAEAGAGVDADADASTDRASADADRANDEPRVTKLFYTSGRFYVFEPILGPDLIIPLNDEKITLRPSVLNTEFAFFFNKLAVFELSEHIKNFGLSIAYYYKNATAINRCISDQSGAIPKMTDLEMVSTLKYLEILSGSYDVYVNNFVLSSLICLNGNHEDKTRYLNQIIQNTLSSGRLTDQERFFIYYQCIRISFVNASVGSRDTSVFTRRLYRNIFKGYLANVKGALTFIPKHLRDKKSAIVMTGQYLALEHGPTKTALDRCYSLIKRQGMDVILINTREVLTTLGAVPFHNAIFGNVIEELQAESHVQYQDISIPYYQIDCQMPDVNGLLKIVEMVKQRKPYFILTIGGNSIVSDVCSKIVPTIVISTVPSGLVTTEGQFQVIGRKVNESDIKYLEQFGFDKEHIIESVFTSNFKPQSKTLSREALGLPQRKFLLIIVGARLGDEITREFLDMLSETFEYNTHLVFAGNFNNYEKVCRDNAVIRDNSTYIGFQDDMLAVMEVCDLYVNPKRTGGGTSVAEAMYKGLPAVTTASGDVAIGAGSDFCVGSYSEMADTIIRYSRDKKFYETMSKKAGERVKILMDTDLQLEKIVGAAVSGKLFR